VLSEAEPRKANLLSAPVLLFVLSIVLALATAYMWMGKTSRLSQEGGSIEILNYTCSFDSHMNWEIVVFLCNSGNASVVLGNVYVNNMEVSVYGAEGPSLTVGTITTDQVKGWDIPGGGEARVVIWIGGKFGFLISGNVVDFKILSAGGLEVGRSVRLA
jgi:hypothetical protein